MRQSHAESSSLLIVKISSLRVICPLSSLMCPLSSLDLSLDLRTTSHRVAYEAVTARPAASGTCTPANQPPATRCCAYRFLACNPTPDLSMVDSNPWRRQGSRPQDCRSRSKTCAWGALEAFHRRGGGTAGSRRSSTPPVAADTTRRSVLLMRFSGISGIPEPEISGTRIVGFLFSLR